MAAIPPQSFLFCSCIKNINLCRIMKLLWTCGISRRLLQKLNDRKFVSTLIGNPNIAVNI